MFVPSIHAFSYIARFVLTRLDKSVHWPSVLSRTQEKYNKQNSA